MSSNYFGLIDKPISSKRRNSTKSIELREKSYYSRNKDKGIGKSSKGLTKMSKDIKNMSVWD